MISSSVAANIARESFSALLLAILLLLTACGSSGQSMRAELAPPPPFTATPAQQFGPLPPVEIVMIQSLQTIEPAAGDPVIRTCSTRTSYTQEEGRLGLGFGDLMTHDGELSFSRLHSSPDAAEMTIQFTLPLPTMRTIGCR